jgi:uncharacterized protein DUF481
LEHETWACRVVRFGVVFSAVFAALGGTALAQKTDVVTLGNGDRITGEVSKLDRGQLEYKTDDIGTIYLEWDKIISLKSTAQFQVGTSDGRLFLGSLDTDGPRTLVIVTSPQNVALPTEEVTLIIPIGKSFWTKLDGSIDIGFSYTKSSDIAQLNVNSSTVYNQPAWEVRLSGSATITESGDPDEADDRATAQMSFLRYRGQNNFWAAAAGVDSNESLGLLLRTQGAFAVGRRVVNTNRAQVTGAAGVSVNDERAIDADPGQNIEALFTFRTSYFSYDRPKTNVDIGFQYYASLNDWGRQRIQLDSNVKREFWKDVFFSVNVFDSFDSDPPSEEADTNDVGVTFSFGWSY